MSLLEYICDSFGLSEFEANGYIMAGKVLVNDEVCSWIKYKVKADDSVRIKYKKTDFVTRAGRKLEKAINVFGLEISGRTVLDIGAAEGGFTDCLLKHGARRVYAVDVAYGILDYGLRRDPRVVALERKNAKFLTEEDIPEPVDYITSDVSFISLRKVIPVNLHFLKPDGKTVLLFKPQFELPAIDLGRNGIPLTQESVIAGIEELVSCIQEKGLNLCDIRKSPIKGNSGNVEYLLLGTKTKAEVIDRSQIESCVSAERTEDYV